MPRKARSGSSAKRSPSRTPLGGAWTEERIPDGVTLESLVGLTPDPASGFRKYLEFLPDGTTDDATIVISNDRQDRVTLKVVGATSRVSIEAPPGQP